MKPHIKREQGMWLVAWQHHQARFHVLAHAFGQAIVFDIHARKDERMMA